MEVAARVAELTALTIHVRGLVQGVGFRPTVWRLARQYEVRGYVQNDGQGVHILGIGTPAALMRFVEALRAQAPVLARVDDILCDSAPVEEVPPGFTILGSVAGAISTGVVPDAATCGDCLQEIRDPSARRYRYPFTNCTHCGPRLTIQEHIPYDRSGTAMRRFAMCAACEAEYQDPGDRRFHAQPIACHACGPKVWLEHADGRAPALDASSGTDAVAAAGILLQRGEVVAIKGLGGVQLACDAVQEDVVARLRRLKGRDEKPFALMARDLAVIRQYCRVGKEEQRLLSSPAAPIVILQKHAGIDVAAGVAPRLHTLGFMLPNTPLHHLLLRDLDRPIVLTSGNRSDEPQWIENEPARMHLGNMAAYFLLHDRAVAQRVDDSVTMVMQGVPRVLRRSRGYAPAPVGLPAGFEEMPAVLALGGELKNTFCLLAGGRAILSHHIGDLEDARTYADYRRALTHYRALFAHRPELLAIDRHPDYLSGKLGRELAAAEGLALADVQHHHAHLAACLAENGISLDHPPVLGVVLDGLGYGDDGTLWGGEFLLADYRTARRLATFKPVRMLGGAQAIAEPWRSTYAHLVTGMGWAGFAAQFQTLALHRMLAAKPRAILDQMLTRGLNSPLASSCGRLFDAVAVALGCSAERASYEGRPAVELEQLVDPAALRAEGDGAYPFAISTWCGPNVEPRTSNFERFAIPCLDPLPMWRALLQDLQAMAPVSIMAARFHKGLAMGICTMLERLTRNSEGARSIDTIALSGGVFQNRILFELLAGELTAMGFVVLSHARVPTNDGGLALGQAVVAAARARVLPANGPAPGRQG
jgi:hydrogenase maturation protein HypF